MNGKISSSFFVVRSERERVENENERKMMSLTIVDNNFLAFSSSFHCLQQRWLRNYYDGAQKNNNAIFYLQKSILKINFKRDRRFFIS